MAENHKENIPAVPAMKLELVPEFFDGNVAVAHCASLLSSLLLSFRLCICPHHIPKVGRTQRSLARFDFNFSMDYHMCVE